MKTILTISIFLMFSIISPAQIPEISWQNCFGTDQLDWTYCIAEKENGNLLGIYITTNATGITYYHGEADAWILNIDEFGNVIWEKCFGGSESEDIDKIIKVTDNEYYLVGATESSDYDITCDTNYGSTDFWVLKINGTGDIIWDHCYGSINGDEMRDAVLTPDGGLLFMGRITSNGGDVKKYYGSMDLWFCKIDSLGNIDWEKTVGNQSNDNGISMQLISDTSFAFTGGYYEPGGMNDCQIPVTGDGADLWLVEMSLTNGEILNIYCYGGSGHDLGYYFDKLDDGYILTASTDSWDGDVIGQHGGYDFWVVRINQQGQIVWQRCLGGSDSETPYYITQVEDGGFIVIGNTRSHDGDVTNNHSEWGYDIWVVKLSASGEIIWSQCYGGVGDERFWGTHSILKKSDYNYVFNAQAKYNSGDVQCELTGGIDAIDAWVFEIKDCSVYAPAIPQTPTGSDTVCNQSGQAYTFTISPAALAWSYEWLLQPATAGTLTADTLETMIEWADDFTGTATLVVRSVNDCGVSEWSAPKYVQVNNCLYIADNNEGKISVSPNPASQFVEFKVEGSKFKVGDEIRIFGMLGNELARLPVQAEKTVWDVRDVRDVREGIYFYTVDLEGQRYCGKVVIQK